MRIFIIGFMGSGKSTLGRPIARVMDYELVDLDALIEQEEGVTISEIFTKYGEIKFRELENYYLRTLTSRDNIVISTGGGTPCSNNNMALMNSAGITIYLKQSPELLASRLSLSKKRRPLLEEKTDEELLQYITDKLTEREPIYGQAAIIVDNPTRDVSRIIDILKLIPKTNKT